MRFIQFMNAVRAVTKKILIAGATGYLGKNLLVEAKRQGHYVRALTRDAKNWNDTYNISMICMWARSPGLTHSPKFAKISIM